MAAKFPETCEVNKEPCLGPTDLKVIYKELFEVRAKWRRLGLVLDLAPVTLDEIRQRYSEPEDRLERVLLEWLSGGLATWRQLVGALWSRPVSETKLAQEMERKYCQKAVVTSNSHHQTINKRVTIFSDKKIGSGAFGVVFEGSYRGNPCAVKILHDLATQIRTNLPVGNENEEAIKAFDRECEFLESFQHPNIVRHMSTDEYPMSGSTILVTELMDCNLRSYLSGLGEESLTSHCQLSLSRDAASGLAYIHSRQIIHRDLCGDNILLRLSKPVPIAKISDFGMSRLLDPSQMSSTLTAIGHRMGYLPPEALRLEDEEYNYSLDVFSLGVIVMQIVCKVGAVKTAKDRSFNVSQIPTTHCLKVVITDCLQEDRRKRPTARDICATIETELMVEAMGQVVLSPRVMVPSNDYVIQGRGSSAPVREVEATLDDLQSLRCPLTLNWRKGEDMPIEMGGPVQSVVIKENVYVGGGWTGGNNPVMKLDFKQEKWTELPQYSAMFFAMTSLNNKLVLVGGWDSVKGKVTNQISILEGSKWCCNYSPMNTACHSLTAVGFNEHIIVAGGFDARGRLISSVEVLNVALRRWYVAESLPKPHLLIKSSLVGNTLYVMGGLVSKRVHMVDLNKLITRAKSKWAIPTHWQAIEDIPVRHSAPLSAGGSLLAVGGHDGHHNPSSSIHLYRPIARRWVKVGDLPTARYDCTCSVLNPSGKIIVAGGEAVRYITVSQDRPMSSTCPQGDTSAQRICIKYISTVDFLSFSKTVHS